MLQLLFDCAHLRLYLAGKLKQVHHVWQLRGFGHSELAAASQLLQGRPFARGLPSCVEAAVRQNAQHMASCKGFAGVYRSHRAELPWAVHKPMQSHRRCSWCSATGCGSVLNSSSDSRQWCTKSVSAHLCIRGSCLARPCKLTHVSPRSAVQRALRVHISGFAPTASVYLVQRSNDLAHEDADPRI